MSAPRVEASGSLSSSTAARSRSVVRRSSTRARCAAGHERDLRARRQRADRVARALDRRREQGLVALAPHHRHRVVDHDRGARDRAVAEGQARGDVRRRDRDARRGDRAHAQREQQQIGQAAAAALARLGALRAARTSAAAAAAGRAGGCGAPATAAPPRAARAARAAPLGPCALRLDPQRLGDGLLHRRVGAREHVARAGSGAALAAADDELASSARGTPCARPRDRCRASRRSRDRESGTARRTGSRARAGAAPGTRSRRGRARAGA